MPTENERREAASQVQDRSASEDAARAGGHPSSRAKGVHLLEGEDMSGLNMLLFQILNQSGQKAGK